MNMNQISVDRRSLIRSLSRFGLVGMTTAAIYFFLLWIGDEIFSIPYVLSISLAYSVSTVFNFLASRHFTFSILNRGADGQIVRYLILWAINYLITILVVRLCVHGRNLSLYTGVSIALVFTTAVGYILSRFWVFKAKEGSE